MQVESVLPLVSIILPIYNEAPNIKPCLTTILDQDYALERIEVLVIDAESSDGCVQQVVNFASAYPRLAIRLIQKPKHIIPVGLNIGIRVAQGEIIIRADARTRLAKDYVSNCVRHLQEGKADNVGGVMRPVGTNYVSKAYSLAATSPFSAGDAKFHYSEREQYVDTVYLGAFWRKTFDRIGLYDEDYGSEDSELNYRLRQAGGKILLSPEVKSTYLPRSTLRALWGQYFTYGGARILTLQKHPASLRWRQTVAPLFVLALLGTLLLTYFTPWLFVLVAGSYLLANLVASTITAKKGGWSYLPVLPVIFAIIHIGWALGFWYGLGLIIVKLQNSK